MRRKVKLINITTLYGGREEIYVIVCECGGESGASLYYMNLPPQVTVKAFWEESCTACNQPYYTQEEQDLIHVLGYDPDL